MARKRAASTRVPVEPSTRGRLRRSARSTSAIAPEDQVGEEPTVEDQPPASEEQQAPSPTPEQELQQLQAQLQSMQQERDRVAAAFTANQRAAQTSSQAAEIRQQLAILQAEIQSMQPSQSSFNTSNQFHSANQSKLNPPTYHSSTNHRHALHFTTNP